MNWSRLSETPSCERLRASRGTIARMLILVDGYNVTKGDPATAALSLEEQRDALVARLRTRGAELLGRGRIVVVFDGVSGMGLSMEPAPAEVRYSRNESADDLIVRLAAREPSALRLITSDAELAERVRAMASVTVEVYKRERAYASARAVGPHAPRQNRETERSLGIPPGGREITRELEKLWLEDHNEE